MNLISVDASKTKDKEALKCHHCNTTLTLRDGHICKVTLLSLYEVVGGGVNPTPLAPFSLLPMSETKTPQGLGMSRLSLL